MPDKTKKMNKKVLVQCATRVNRTAISRKQVDGVEHIVINSKTLPNDIVMNGGLYPTDEVDKSYASLERTLAPVEHPTDSSGNFISATDPMAIHNFYAGAFNENVQRESGRISIDKVINVQEALKTDRGKRLLDRISEIETSNDARPIHTSVGVFLEVEETDGPKTNAAGQEYTWVARNMVFDHDAILLDSVGAAQPSQGVGIGVNRQGDELDVQHFVINEDMVTVPVESVDEMSHEDLREALRDALNTPPLSADWIAKVYPSYVVYEFREQYFSVPYTIGNGTVTITGIPVPVQRDESYIPKTNRKGDAMREQMLAALAAAGVTVNADISDVELMAKYNALLTANQDNSSDDDGASDDKATLADVVANALKPLAEKLDGLEAKINEKDTAEVDRLAGIVGNSEKYPGLTEDAAKALGVDVLKSMAANCQPSFGVPLSINHGSSDDNTSYEMPK